jgi:hypothetical protein
MCFRSNQSKFHKFVTIIVPFSEVGQAEENLVSSVRGHFYFSSHYFNPKNIKRSSKNVSSCDEHFHELRLQNKFLH